ncbi:MAG: hypothetical protein KJ686_11005, partial [Actinobacteria bacterium]|nr:hypothetical protein [Actinomycetota bacterium]
MWVADPRLVAAQVGGGEVFYSNDVFLWEADPRLVHSNGVSDTVVPPDAVYCRCQQLFTPEFLAETDNFIKLSPDQIIHFGDPPCNSLICWAGVITILFTVRILKSF